ncbi:MAG: universal stress protein [Rhizobacter sp.]|nr:universal stress protein [Rhizobacter sp.]
MVLPANEEMLERVTGAVGSRALAGSEALFNAAGVTYEREIGSGEPAATLVDMAERHGCATIIMGARGLGPLRSALLGSVSQGVLQGARHHRQGRWGYFGALRHQSTLRRPGPRH